MPVSLNCPQESGARRKSAKFVVIVRGVVRFRAKSLSEAFGWAEGYGSGIVAEVLGTASPTRKAVRR